MREVSKRNIDDEVSDIRAPEGSRVRLRDSSRPARKSLDELGGETAAGRTLLSPASLRRIPLPPRQGKHPLRREIFIFFFATILLGSLVWAWRGEFAYEARIDRGPGADGAVFDSARNALRLLRDRVGEGGRTLSELGIIAGEAARIAAGAKELMKEAPFLMLDQHGPELALKISALKSSVDGLLAARENTGKNAAIFDDSLSLFGGNLSFDVTAREWSDLLGAMAAWLISSEEHHIIVFFQNPSEIRPTGGFWGSFAHVVVRGGNIVSITAHDINEVDRTFESRIVPPEPLRLVSRRWTTANANWFFDFPQSAEKALGFMEASEFFGKEGIRFDGAIAITGRPIEDVLRIVGPVELGSGITVTDQNVMQVIQKEVHERRNNGDDVPKQVIGVLADALVEKARNASPEARGALLGLLGTWFEEKDVMVSMRASDFRNALRRYGVDGSLYPTTALFRGDYLAVVAANVKGEKTDLFLEEEVFLESQIGADGVVQNHLTVTRIHNGDRATEWWYRVPNQAYLMVHVPRGARLTDVRGEAREKIPSVGQYEESGYSRDPDVTALETTEKDLLKFPSVRFLTLPDKDIVAAWMKVARGARGTIAFQYERRLPEPPRDGSRYSFVLETQAGIPARRGMKNPYIITLHAPLGFVWAENGLPVYEWKSDDPPGRVVIELTFRKL